MEPDAGPWLEEFVGARLSLPTLLVAMAGFAWLAPALSRHPLQWPPAFITAGLFLLALGFAVRPNRLRLGREGFELVRPWRPRLYVRWKDTGPPYFVSFPGRGGTYEIVRCEYVSPSGGKRRTVSLPTDLGATTHRLLFSMIEARAITRDGRVSPPQDATS